MIVRVLRRMVPTVAAVVLVAYLLVSSTAMAASTPGPHWEAISIPAPTWFHPGDTDDIYEVGAINDGGAATSGQITLTDTLPAGVTVVSVTGSISIFKEPGGLTSEEVPPCSETSKNKAVTLTCTTSTSVSVGRFIAIKVSVNVPHNASGTLLNSMTINGGGAATATTTGTTPVTPASQTPPFGVSATNDVVDANGLSDTQAGSHPYSYTTLLAFNSAGVNQSEKCGAELADGQFKPTIGCPTQTGGWRDIEVALPAGMVGNPGTIPRCSQREFQSQGYTECPAATQVGTIELSFYSSDTNNEIVPVYNIQPSPDQPAELGFTVSSVAHIAILFHSRPVPQDGGYALITAVSGITQLLDVRTLAITIWGTPAEESHTPLRASTAEGEHCPGGGLHGDCPSNAPLRPFLTLPTSCPGTPIKTETGVDDWQDPLEAPLPITAETELGTMSGCEALTLQGTGHEPSLAVEPSTHQAGVPAGYGVTLKVPQNEEPEGLATPDIKNVEVTMPEGTVISPSAANGLIACTSEQFAQGSETVGNCPASSKIGTVKIVSPLLETPLTGSVFVGEPECSPCTASQAQEGKMVHLLIEARLADPQREGELSQEEREKLRPSVLIKLSGHTRIDPSTGRLAAVFNENPQLPFGELTLSLENGPDAPLVNPIGCGPVYASGTFAPWSGTAPVSVSSAPVSLEDCATPSFSPSLAAGMSGSSQAGAFSPFSVAITRPDGQQALGSVTFTTPPGVSGVIAGIPLCGEGEANAGTCSSASQIGEVTSVVGPGSKPYTIGGGKVYLTTGYGGGSFGVSIVVPAQAGPFHLAGVNGAGGEGDGTVVVRGAIHVDPSTAALTITTNPIPTSLDGIPLDIQRVIVNVNRSGFMFNPTNCNAMSVGSTITSAPGASASSSYPFQAANCGTLPFHPSFTASTQGNGETNGHGASLDVKIATHEGPTAGAGEEANIAKVDVQLPVALSSRLKVLQKACTEAQFAANPAGCPQASDVGTAVAHTPILSGALTGPAYLVSHGGEAFPDLVLVLQGEGVTIDLVGHTDIKGSVTYSKFETVPDAPVSSFELSLPEGPDAVLGAIESLCAPTKAETVKERVKVVRHGHIVRRHGHVVYKTKKIVKHVPEALVMPTTITGQNGAVLTQSTPIAVSGCAKKAKVVKAKKKVKHTKRHGKSKK